MAPGRSGLIIASDTYEDPQLRQLRAPGRDAENLAAVLRDPEIGNYEVRVLLNDRHYEVRIAIEEFFLDRTPEDVLLVHFSCHGLKDEEGRFFFAAADTWKKAAEFDGDHGRVRQRTGEPHALAPRHPATGLLL
jgi:hypothetical protein